MSTGEDLLARMRARRSVRRFKPDPVPRPLVEALIEAACTAPSASNKQPWRFQIVTRRAVIAGLAAAVRKAVDRIAIHIEPAFEGAFRAYGDYFTRFEGAPCVVIPLYRKLELLSNMVDPGAEPGDIEAIRHMEYTSGITSTSLAMQNLLLMAPELGLGASGMTGPLVALEAIRTILEVPATWHIAAFIPVGYPDETPEPRSRKNPAQVTRWIE